MPKKRRKFSREFKTEAVRMVSDGGRSVAETARELSISPNLLTRWKNEFAKNGDQAFPGKGRLADEVRRLQLELKRVQDLLHHSDRGGQYASRDYQRELTDRHIVCSMSRRGNCWDNAVLESFFATLKKELVHQHDFVTRQEAIRELFWYIEGFYNTRRRHSFLGQVSPMEFEDRNSIH